MKRKNLKEKFYLVFILPLGVVIFARLANFIYLKTFGFEPEMIIDKKAIHYYIFGATLILFAGAIYFLERKKGSNFIFIFLGLGLGSALDEVSIWFPGLSRSYWGIDNFIIIAVYIIIFLIFIVFFKDAEKFNQTSIKNRFHENPQNPFISVVIPAFNEEKFIAVSLQSLILQHYQNFELIVVDNNSSDRTAEIAGNFGAKIVFERRQGVGFARQRGFHEAKGKIIATTDADSFLPSNWLSRIAKEFQSDRKLVAFGGLYNFYSGTIMARTAILFFSYPAWIFDRIFSGGWSLPGANLAVRKESFLKIGGFRTELNLGEDADISQRLRKMGRVRLDRDFKILVSGRRFRHGLVGLMAYVPGSLARIFFRKHKFAKLPAVREENSLFNKLAFLPFVCLIVVLFYLFYVSNPSIARAKNIRFVRGRMVLAENKMKKEGRSVERNLVNIKKAKLKWKKTNHPKRFL